MVEACVDRCRRFALFQLLVLAIVAATALQTAVGQDAPECRNPQQTEFMDVINARALQAIRARQGQIDGRIRQALAQLVRDCFCLDLGEGCLFTGKSLTGPRTFFAQPRGFSRQGGGGNMLRQPVALAGDS